MQKIYLSFVLFLSLVFSCFFQPLSAQLTFTDWSDSAGLNHYFFSSIQMGGGVAILDYDKDGWEDFYITGGTYSDRLMHNNGDGTFTDMTLAAGITRPDTGIVTFGAITGDIDNDGYREIYVGTEHLKPNLLYYNNGDGTFTEIGISAGVGDTARTFSSAFGDVNQDGYLDLYVGNYVEYPGFTYDTLGGINGFAHHCWPNRLFLNNGDNTFTNIADLASIADTGCTLASALTDYDHDGDVDVYVINDFGEFIVTNKMYRNEHPLVDTYTDVSVASGLNSQMYGMGVAIGDYDRDEDLDYYITNLGRNQLLQNQGAATFLNVTTAAGVENGQVDTLNTTGWGTSFVDVDNDGWLDLQVANGQILAAPFIATTPEDSCKMYLNNHDGTFTDISLSSGFYSTYVERGLAYSDFDRDGDVDFFLNGQVADTSSGEHAVIYRNELAPGSNWIDIFVEGTVSNRDGFGTHVILYTDGWSIRAEVNGGGTHLSNHSPVLHFGLDTVSSVDSIRFIWPAGMEQVVYNPPINQIDTVVEDSTMYITRAQDGSLQWEESLTAYPNPFHDKTIVRMPLHSKQEVDVRVFDLSGKCVRHIAGGNFGPGLFHAVWDGDSDAGMPMQSGLYIIRLVTGNDQVRSARVLLRR